jgi:hypothetical protein
MDDTAEPLGPVLVFSEKHYPVATGLFPLLAKMKRQHAERRGRRDRGSRGVSTFFGRAFPNHPTGAGLLAFFHETSIVIQECSCSESPTKYKLFTFRTSLELPRRPSFSKGRQLDELVSDSVEPLDTLACARQFRVRQVAAHRE